MTDETRERAPCDCCEVLDGTWVQSCNCGNSGSLSDAQSWCTRQNVAAELARLEAERDEARATLESLHEECDRQLNVEVERLRDALVSGWEWRGLVRIRINGCKEIQVAKLEGER